MSKQRIHAQPHVVYWSWDNYTEIPEKDDDFRHIYSINMNGKSIGVGQTSNMKERIPNGYVYKIRTDKYDGSTIITAMQEMAKNNDNELTFSAKFLQRVPRKEALIAEGIWIERLRSEGHELLNRTRAIKIKC